MKHQSAHELIARAIVIRDNRLLVNRSRNKKTGEDYCALPGGHVDPGESCQFAVQREFGEELGAEIEVGDICFVSESIYAGRSRSDEQRHELVLYFEARAVRGLREDGAGVLSPEPNKNFAWIDLQELPALNLKPQAVKDFLLARDGQNPARYVFHDDNRHTG